MSSSKRAEEQNGTGLEASFSPAPFSLLNDPHTQRLLLPAAAFVGAMAGYLLTFARTVTLVDSGELILTSATFGVAHPPGFPLYTLLGHFFTKLPFGSVAARVSFMSAFFAALTAATLTLIAIEINGAFGEYRLRPEGGKKRSSGKGAEKGNAAAGTAQNRLAELFNLVMPVTVGLTFAFSVTLWFYASVAEVYTLNIALFAAIVYLMLRWHLTWTRSKAEEKARRTQWLVPAAAGVYGLALCVHHVTILLTLPAFALLVWRTAGIRYFFGREVGMAFVTVLLGFSVYLYLPVAAARAPVLNWGNPSNWQRFYWHISGKQYQVNLFSANAGQVMRQIDYFLSLLFHQFTPFGLAGGLIGLWALWRRKSSLFWLLSLIILFNVAYSLNYEIAEDKDAYYLTTDLAMAIALGAGARYLFDWSTTKGRRFAAGMLPLLVALPLGNFGAHYFENNKSRYTIARDFVENSLSSVEPGGLLMTMDWQFYSPYLYMHHIENLRPDATVVNVNLVRRSWYVEGYLQRQYPEMMRACAAEAEAYLEDLRLFEQGKPYDVARINKNFIGLINAFIKYHVPGRAAYTMLPMEEGVGAEYTWVPQGLTLRLYPDKNFHPEPTPPLQLRGLLDGSIYLDEVAKGKVRRTYAMMMANRGKYLGLGGRYDEALNYLHQSLQLDSQLDRAYEFMGDIYSAQGKLDDAARAYREALQLNPANSSAGQRLQALRR